jgi:hypothetical protein
MSWWYGTWWFLGGLSVMSWRRHAGVLLLRPNCVVTVFQAFALAVNSPNNVFSRYCSGCCLVLIQGGFYPRPAILVTFTAQEFLNLPFFAGAFQLYASPLCFAVVVVSSRNVRIDLCSLFHAHMLGSLFPLERPHFAEILPLHADSLQRAGADILFRDFQKRTGFHGDLAQGQ